MGYQLVGYEGSITSWEGTVNTHLAANWIAGRNMNLNLSSPDLDVTQYASGLVTMKKRANIRQATLTFDGLCDKSSPAHGNNGNVSFSGGYATHVREWTFNASATVVDITQFTGSAVTNRLYRPGLLTVSGTFSAFVDSSTALVQTGVPSTSAAALVLTLSSGNTITVDAIATAMNVSVPIDGIQEVSYSWVTNDNTVAFAGTDNMIPAGDLAIPEWNDAADGIPDRDLVFKLGSAQTITVPAFWSSLSITCPVDGMATTSVGIQCAGPLVWS